MSVVIAPQMITGEEMLAPAGVVVEGGRVVDVVADSQVERLRADVTLLDGLLVPGLVDLQVNGYFGVDLISATPAEWAAVAARLPGTGVTAFAPTFITGPLDRLTAGLRRAEHAMVAGRATHSARIVGVHLEGPFLASSRRGAHSAAFLRDPTDQALDLLLEAAAPGTLRLVTLAPERPGALGAVRRLTAAGVVVGLGHTDATAVQVSAAADAGARMVTHLFNAQRGLHHREPGVVGAGLVDHRLTCGLILDLHHVAAEVARLVFAAAPGRIVLVTDAVAAAGMPPGCYVLGDEPVIVESGRPPVRNDGTLAGSGLRLDEAVANAVALGVDVVSAVAAASQVPADLLGRTDLGRIAPGAAADLVWLGDDLRARATWIGGKLVFGADEAVMR
ncbi:MAG: N-acetylglucosamine-6-phosphate deacetylase [Actinomycetota bacterium]|nr:N-acetylglucosamine-6-phosphate deacetylase [Actinomycetota bacterium]